MLLLPISIYLFVVTNILAFGKIFWTNGERKYHIIDLDKLNFAKR